MALRGCCKRGRLALTRHEQKGLAYENAFSGATSFLQAPLREGSRGSRSRESPASPSTRRCTNSPPGCRLGPRAIREASRPSAVRPALWLGATTQLSAVPHRRHARHRLRLRPLRRGAGPDRGPCGGHTRGRGGPRQPWGATIPDQPAASARPRRRHGPLSLFQFDAHSDTWADDDAPASDHGTMFYKAVKEGGDAPRDSRSGRHPHNNPDTLGHRPDRRAQRASATARSPWRSVFAGSSGTRPVYLSLRYRRARSPTAAPGTGTPVWAASTRHRPRSSCATSPASTSWAATSSRSLHPRHHGGDGGIAGAHVALEMICLWGWTRRPAKRHLRRGRHHICRAP